MTSLDDRLEIRTAEPFSRMSLSRFDRAEADHRLGREVYSGSKRGAVRELLWCWRPPCSAANAGSAGHITRSLDWRALDALPGRRRCSASRVSADWRARPDPAARNTRAPDAGTASWPWSSRHAAGASKTHLTA